MKTAADSTSAGSDISAAYIGVHQMFQIALAAQELGRLDRFYCSFFNAPGKWGGRLAGVVGEGALFNFRLPGIAPEKVSENPWPMLRQTLSMKLQRGKRAEWSKANARFDGWVARQLARGSSRIFVGAETCCEQSFHVGKSRGLKLILDCPGIAASFLDEAAVAAAKELRLPIVRAADSALMQERKRREVEMADHVLVCSEVARRSQVAAGVPAEKITTIPLWIDTEFWLPNRVAPPAERGPLRVLFAGGITLRKGIPYLLRAAAAIGDSVNLTLAGPLDSTLQPFLDRHRGFVRILPPRAKPEMPALYHQHDLLVLPSLGDSFGFVALEAMACGLPVVVTENCGVPVPDESWRVPVMDSNAIARRLTYYAEDRGRLEVDGARAVAFARQFTPSFYRSQIKKVFQRCFE